MKSAPKDYYVNFILEDSAKTKTRFDTKTDLTFQGYHDSTGWQMTMGISLHKKIERIRTELDTAVLDTRLAREMPSPQVDQFDSFHALTEDDVNRLILKSNRKPCSLDPMPTPCYRVLLGHATSCSYKNGKFAIWPLP